MGCEQAVHRPRDQSQNWLIENKLSTALLKKSVFGVKGDVCRPCLVAVCFPSKQDLCKRWINFTPCFITYPTLANWLC